MNKPLTLKKNIEFRKVYQKGKSTANRNLVLYYMPNNLQEFRVGITVSKKVGKSVVRNLVKRRIRESLRELAPLMPAGYDLVWIARASCQEADYKTIKSAVKHLAKKAFKGQEKKTIEKHPKEIDSKKQKHTLEKSKQVEERSRWNGNKMDDTFH